MDQYYNIGFIGSGNMAEALCKEVLNSWLFAPEHIYSSDIPAERRYLFSSQGDSAAEDNGYVKES